MSADEARLLTARDVRQLTTRFGIRPSKQRGQNFVIDPNTVRRIVRSAGLVASDVVLEVGSGFGSLTLGLLPNAASVVAVEIDRGLASALPIIVAERAAAYEHRLVVLHLDALTLVATGIPGAPPSVCVANLPYNVAVPVLLHLMEGLPSISHGLVMVQSEVADRLVAAPGSRTYGVPSVKAAWYAAVSRVGAIGRTVFWPRPNVDSALIRFIRREPPAPATSRAAVFEVVDAAFAQRRKSLRAALAGWAGSPGDAEQALRQAGVDPMVRGEQLSIDQFVAIASHRPSDHP